MNKEGATMLIPLKEYAERHGKVPDNVRQKANRGKFKTAVRMGRDWFIDEDEPFEDARIKSGKYVDWKYRHRKSNAVQEETKADDTQTKQGTEDEEAQEAGAEGETEE